MDYYSNPILSILQNLSLEKKKKKIVFISIFYTTQQKQNITNCLFNSKYLFYGGKKNRNPFEDFQIKYCVE